ncbi:hypothetical protein [Flagellimonas sediminis]|uniref:SIR2-like domain-containing protein n=1 Tax=Flagellimonas sediminis TaxID=2696468 RepID=A0A6I5KQF3_9FLAO|nr:hypothetical protein [Allomuricauda sediminis]NDV43114.1 hypothetical protein [Allomuricauda sediminis]
MSKTGMKMPVAKDFFDTFRGLEISENPWVLIGDLINYIVRYRKIEIEHFDKFNEDIEILHSEIQGKLYDALRQRKNFFDDLDDLIYLKAYNQLIFLFVSVINEIQNGPISDAHINLAKQLGQDDSIITFNWDTLMDRALKQETDWTTDFGYFRSPKLIYRNRWVRPQKSKKHSFPTFLKLHGSSNWLTSHTAPENGKLELTQEVSIDEFFVYENNKEPYNCHAGRYMNGYEDFSYGYYPPNLPLSGKSAPKGMMVSSTRIKFPNVPEGTSESSGLVSMPLIIPPVQHKEYDQFGSLFESLWNEAEKKIQEADKIIIIGYSFPNTDYRSSELFKSAFVKRSTMPKITIINPTPDPIAERFIYELGITESNLLVKKEFFTEKTIL